MMPTTIMADQKLAPPCTHHWRIAEPVAGERFSPGVCAHCGEERLWDNWAVEDRGYSWVERQQYGARRRQ